MTTNEHTALKQQLLAECRRVQQQKADTARQAMLDVQESANESQGAIEDKFESFREACQIQRDLYARQLDEALTSLQVLQRLPETRVSHQEPSLGTIVVTDAQRFYISVSLGEIAMEGEKYFVISAFSPMYQAMAKSRVGQTYTFRGRPYRIEAIY